MSATKNALGTVVTVAVVIAVVLGGWFGYWWIRGDSVNRNASIRRDSFEVQQTYREQVLARADDIARIDTQLTDPALTAEQRSALAAQREATRRLGCDQVQRLTGALPPAVEDFALIECGGR